MDINSISPCNPPSRLLPAKLTPTKRSHSISGSHEHASKKIKTLPEEPALYSENVRRKLAGTSRTGQACDRCKERKMKCDPDPEACQPCRQKNLKCYTTDRVTGLPKERGQSDRAESELIYLRDQLSQYQQKFGLLQSNDALAPCSNLSSPTVERAPSMLVLYPEYELKQNYSSRFPSPHYEYWPCSIANLVYGPIDGTKVELMDLGSVDIIGFDCHMMRDLAKEEFGVLNFSKTSILRSLWHQQSISEPPLPPKEETLADAHVFFTAMWGFIPVVHRPSFLNLIDRLYEEPSTVSFAERVQVFAMMAIVAHQTAMRNVTHKARLDQSFHYLHFALSTYRVLSQERSLPAMQALALILVHFRNLPKPGYTWEFSQNLLISAIDMNYHRDPERIDLPASEQNILAKELRKRVFISILGICITTGCRIGRPSPWQFAHWDIPLPMAVKDSEISIHGLSSQLSGQCDIWPCIQLAKLLPLMTELFNYVQCVRHSAQDYVKIVDVLRTKIEAWRTDWDDTLDKANEDKKDVNVVIFTLLIDSWVAEFLLNLHHPKVCPAGAADVMERNLDVCHKAAKRLLTNSHNLARKYKACDFTWHSTVAYALGFGVTLHIYGRRLGQVNVDQFSNMKNELAGWLNLMAYVDLVMQTNNYLQKQFGPLVKRLEAQYEKCVSSEGHGPDVRKTSATPLQPSVNGPHIKTEASPLLPTSSTHRLTVTTSSRSLPALQISQHMEPGYQSAVQFSSPSGMTTASCTVYNSGPPEYPQFPISLAPLLNDPSPTNLMHYQTSAATLAQDLSTIFQPQVYTDPTTSSMWPINAEGSFAG